MPSSQFQRSQNRLCLCGTPRTTFGTDGTWLSPGQAFAKARGIVETIRSEAAKAPITVHPLRGSIAILEGSGGNIAVLVGRDGKVLVDAGIAVSRRQVAAALATLGPEPVTHLINTHWHFDHADGNGWLQELSPTIIAHENTRRHLSTTQRVEDWDFGFMPLPEAALPTEVFATERRLTLDGTTLALRYYGPAHTDSDISVHFEEPDVLHVADTYWNGVYPFIDYSTGGSIDGSIRAAEANLALANENTVVIPGHGFPVSDRAGLQRFRDMRVTVRDGVAALKALGRSLEEIVAARPTAAFDTEVAHHVRQAGGRPGLARGDGADGRQDQRLPDGPHDGRKEELASRVVERERAVHETARREDTDRRPSPQPGSEPFGPGTGRSTRGRSKVRLAAATSACSMAVGKDDADDRAD